MHSLPPTLQLAITSRPHHLHALLCLPCLPCPLPGLSPSQLAIHSTTHVQLKEPFPGGTQALEAEMFGARDFLNQTCGIPLEVGAVRLAILLVLQLAAAVSGPVTLPLSSSWAGRSLCG